MCDRVGLGRPSEPLLLGWAQRTAGARFHPRASRLRSIMAHMPQTLFDMVAGAGFILLGRWRFGRVKYLLNDAPGPFVITWRRFSGGLSIFVGSYAIVEAPLSRVAPNLWTIIVSAASGIAGVWFLRPRVEPLPAAVGPLSRKGKWAFGIALSVAALFVAGIFAGIDNSEACRAAVTQAESNAVVIQQLGQPIHRGLFVSGEIKVTGPSGDADLAIPLYGPKGRGTLHAVGVKSAGIWQFRMLQLAIQGKENQIDLLSNSEK